MFQSALELEIIHAGLRRLGPFWCANALREPFWRLYWNLDSGASLALPDRTVAIEPGRLYFIAPCTKGRFKCEGSPRHLFVHFFAGHPFDKLENFVFGFPAKPWQAELAGELASVLRVSDQSVYGRFDFRLALLAKSLAFAALRALPDSILEAADMDSRILKAVERLDAPGRRPSNAELAAEAGMAVNSFIRLFRKETGQSPQERSIKKRVERAALMLEYGEAELHEIALACGFCDRYHLSKIFKACVGESPCAYRKARRARQRA